MTFLRTIAEAVTWFRMAAEQGNAIAQFNLGIKYLNGQGVPQDDAEAVRWFQQAADQGHAGGQFNLGVMYEEGRGVPQDFDTAHMWFNLATARATGENRERAKKARDAVAEEMTKETLAEAQRRARKWEAENPQW